jgi:hypothetical protein
MTDSMLFLKPCGEMLENSCLCAAKPTGKQMAILTLKCEPLQINQLEEMTQLELVLYASFR